MKEETKYDFDKVINTLKTNKPLRFVAYSIGAIIGLYILGKTFKVVAGSVRGFNEFRSAIKGE